MDLIDTPREPGSLLVQVVKRTGTIERVKPGEVPVVELFLLDNQRIVSVELRESMFGSSTRKTVDWHWTAYVESRFPTQAAER